MPSPRSLFRTVVSKNTPRERREAAIDSLEALDATTNLRVIVVTAGLDGPFRRQALAALGRCGATEPLDRSATDTSLDPALQKRAAELA